MLSRRCPVSFLLAAVAVAVAVPACGHVQNVATLAWLNQPQFVLQQDGLYLAVMMKPGPLVLPLEGLRADQLHEPVVPDLVVDKPPDQIAQFDLKHPDGMSYFDFLMAQEGWWAWGLRRLPEQIKIISSFTEHGYLWEVSSEEGETSVFLSPVQQVEEAPGAFRVDFRFVIEDAQGKREARCSAWPGEPSRVVWG